MGVELLLVEVEADKILSLVSDVRFDFQLEKKRSRIFTNVSARSFVIVPVYLIEAS